MSCRRSYFLQGYAPTRCVSEGRPRLRVGLVALILLWPASVLAQEPAIEVLPPLVAQVRPADDEPKFPFLAALPWDRWYVSGEYLVWWLQEGRIPGHLAAGPAGSAGIPGQDGSEYIYGPGRLATRHGNRFVGTRITLGCWIDVARTWAIEGEAFFLERDSTAYEKVSNGDPVLAVPWFDPAKGKADSHIVAGAVPGGTRHGGMVGYTRVELFGQQVNVVRALYPDWLTQLDLIIGTRFLELRDRADPTTASRLYPDGSLIIGTEDHLRAHNFFYGGQVGLRGKCGWGRWGFDGRGLAAFGGNRQLIRAWGYTITHDPTERKVENHGLFVHPSNSGRFERTIFDMVYEVGANVRCQLTDRIQLFAGYTLILWLNPIRAGDQIDLVIDPSQTIARPAIPWQEDLLWAQGLNVGMQFRW